MTGIKSRVPFTPQNPYRKRRPATQKIIFLSLEGSVTEEEYFQHVSDVFSEIKSRVQFISVAEDAVYTAPSHRTPEQNAMLSRVRPKQLAERIGKFKQERDSYYEFSKHPEDEFWIVTDVDENWGLWKEEWEECVRLCQKEGYQYAVSNPFFEMWLLLHHSDPTKEDRAFAVTADHPYERTTHFARRLDALGAPLKKKKSIRAQDYPAEKIVLAVERARSLHKDKQDLCPKYFATTVYLLIEKILDILPRK